MAVVGERWLLVPVRRGGETNDLAMCIRFVVHVEIAVPEPRADGRVRVAVPVLVGAHNLGVLTARWQVVEFLEFSRKLW